MSTDLRQSPVTRRRSWFARWFGAQPTDCSRVEPEPSSGRKRRGGRSDARDAAIRPAVRDLIETDRYAFVLLSSDQNSIEPHESALAWKTLERAMALIPAGLVPIVRSDGMESLAQLSAFFLDRHAVTNRQYQRFVTAGCYDDLELWPREIWPSLMRFTDQSGCPGPAGWARGTFPAGKAEHPVVGVTWYEATAYARWAGKRLPTAAEWQKAGGWPEQLNGGSCTRFPWGDLFDPARANLWASGVGGTVAWNGFPSGDTPNGIHQMSGNVWEWLDDPLDAIPKEPEQTFQIWKPMRRIIGGAYDTYLSGEATCHFVTGQGELDRRANIGFRCAVAAGQLNLSL